ncbi:MAG: hypothetical protein K0R65_661 [Crocinitomicaceae bacterium]|jgi:hypothetical protein|nr:hypothetical protein [Crocinitomicaceae bacterium]
MKKLLFSFLVLLFSSMAFTQSYELVSTSSKSYHKNLSRYYLSDITELSTGDSGTVYGNVPCYYPSAVCYHDFSWLGKQIIKKPDGIYAFLNKDLDSIWINPLASAGSSWLFYRLGAGVFIHAYISSHTLETFCDVQDSVKTISFQCYGPGNIPQTHPMNIQTLKISKNYGFVSGLNFYMFPTSIEKMNLVGRTAPDIGLIPPTAPEVFNFQPGDVFKYRYEYSWEDNVDIRFNRRITSRTDLEHGVRYTYIEGEVYDHFNDLSFTMHYGFDVSEDTLVYNYETFDQNIFSRVPQSSNGDTLFAYDITSQYATPVVSRIIYPEVNSTTSCFTPFDGEIDDHHYLKTSYVEGLGLVISEELIADLDTWTTRKKTSLTSYNKDSDTTNDFSDLCQQFQGYINSYLRLGFSTTDHYIIAYESPGDNYLHMDDFTKIWYRNGIPYDTTNDLTLSNITQDGTYTLKLYNPFCMFTTENEFVNYFGTASIAETEHEKLDIYPNPGNGIFNIDSDKELAYSVFSSDGRKLLEGTTKNKQLDLTGMQQGIYYICFENASNSIRKLIKK